MKVRKEVVPFLFASFITGALVGAICLLSGVPQTCSGLAFLITTAILAGYMLSFFRDPDRDPPQDESLVLSGADGVVAKIINMKEEKYLNTDTVRISIFLSLFNVHVNRSPISGKSKFLGYFPGKRMFTFKEKSSEVNQHNAILIEGKTKCVVKQIVGPVCRRVVYWPDHNNAVDLKMGDKIGMMKFGSRMDIFFPANDVEIVTKVGDKVTAGLTVIAKLNKD